jgi:long-chain acyl-CoA synthetase
MSETILAREWRTLPRCEVRDDMNATDDMVNNAATRPDHPAFARKIDGAWRTVTARRFADEVTALAAGLIASGIHPGDRIALMSATSYEWALCDFAIWTAGAVTVPIYETSSPAQVAWILSDSGASAVFVADAKLRTVVEQARTAGVGAVWTFDDGGLETLRTAGADVSAAGVERRRRAVRADHLASIVYTSGTTGLPKGCMISHRNLVAEVRNVAAADGVADEVLTAQSSVLLFLPLAHILARIVQLVAIHNGAQLAHTGDIQDVAAELVAFRPSVVLAVPRVFEKLYNTAQRKAAADGHGRLFESATTTAIEYSQSLDSGGPGRWLRVKRRAFDRLVYRKLRAAMGGRVTHAVSGGAPLGAQLGHFLRGAGVTILEGYGLTETTAGTTLNLPRAQRIGTVGRPLPGCTVRTTVDGEVLVKGPNVFEGYWHNEPATREAFDDQGWLYTGDLGELHDGYLTITGRCKDLIITAAGKNVAPAIHEDRLRAHWLIEECVVVGDRRPYIGALIMVDQLALGAWKNEHNRPETATVAELRDDPDLLADVRIAVDEANAAVSSAEGIKRFRIVSGELVVGEDLTPTQKVRRAHVLARLADEVEALYR